MLKASGGWVAQPHVAPGCAVLLAASGCADLAGLPGLASPFHQQCSGQGGLQGGLLASAGIDICLLGQVHSRDQDGHQQQWFGSTPLCSAAVHTLRTRPSRRLCACAYGCACAVLDRRACVYVLHRRYVAIGSKTVQGRAWLGGAVQDFAWQSYNICCGDGSVWGRWRDAA